MSENTDAELESLLTDQDDDSGLISSLRKRLREATKKVKDQDGQLEAFRIAAQERAQAAAGKLVDEHQLTDKQKELLLSQVENLTYESGYQYLQDLGILSEEEGAQPEGQVQETSHPGSLGQRAAAAAAGRDEETLEERLAAAKDQAEFNSIIQEHGQGLVF